MLARNILTVVKLQNIFNLKNTGQVRWLSNSMNLLPDQSFNQWFAGFLDGKGTLIIKKDNNNVYFNLVLTCILWDENILVELKNNFGGNTHLIINKNCLRYVNSHSKTLRIITNSLNGELRMKFRQEHFKPLFEAYDIPFIPPKPLTLDNAYAMGLFDGNGTVTGNLKNRSIRISINSYSREVLQELQKLFGGNIYADKRGGFSLELTSELNIRNFLNYSKKFPSKGHKQKRLDLIETFFDLRKKRAYRVESPLHQDWLKFCKDWSYENNNQVLF